MYVECVALIKMDYFSLIFCSIQFSYTALNKILLFLTFIIDNLNSYGKNQSNSHQLDKTTHIQLYEPIKCIYFHQHMS